MGRNAIHVSSEDALQDAEVISNRSLLGSTTVCKNHYLQPGLDVAAADAVLVHTSDLVAAAVARSVAHAACAANLVAAAADALACTSGSADAGVAGARAYAA